MSHDTSPALTALGIRITDGTQVTISGPDGVSASYAMPHWSGPPGPPTAIFMDLDGTTLRSEQFWIDILEATARAAGGNDIRLRAEDRILLQGAPTRTHLAHIMRRYALDASLTELAATYEQVCEALYFTRSIPALAAEISLEPGFGEVRDWARRHDVPLILVTNGNERKAGVGLEVIAHHLACASGSEVCDGVWCAPMRSSWLRPFGANAGKPHPWPYLEAATRGAQLDPTALRHAVAVDDSAAGVCSIRLAGIRSVGFASGNIRGTGAHVFCDHIVDSLFGLLTLLDELTA
ncbi:HAD family hydrolase [Phytomonospora endophytica]|uniref:Beta-phosphoglucomutase-like phosphatase (HAD superfamily) n=1 Tax=Phytomonospora endophytica TaxID=714109 RepID=A0A841FV60_9ACTN|nr:HAD family phosphatase [Phytomonospora endophytica]MBB6038653.1 beta-phosphoglucomutase-like phosphatase (HAD superfamily) [Phytomonospora endophytica]GIG69203.1 hypothetical protein Pen01_54980 [Phytomonospora endophytica]